MGGGLEYSVRKERKWVGSELDREGGMADTKRGRGGVGETGGTLVDLAPFTAS